MENNGYILPSKKRINTITRIGFTLLSPAELRMGQDMPSLNNICSLAHIRGIGGKEAARFS
jgi:hypothetical protein